MSNVTNMNAFAYTKERSDAVLLMFKDSVGTEGWVRLVGTQDLAANVLLMLDASPGSEIGIIEAGRMPPDMTLDDFTETLTELSCEVGKNGWLKVNREAARATIEHLIDMRENPIHLSDFEPTS
jgi:hypothetical protein